jgi:tRNA pseudouridine55 synthase
VRSGLLLVDKPVGPSSFKAIARVRKLCDERQVGHAGTLDPLASGLLQVLVGEATKLVPYLMGLEKEYVATARLGAATDTYDAEGKVTSEAPAAAVAAIDEAAVRAALAGFVGRIAQRPPAFSAIKVDGQRLYERAREQGAESVVVEEREIEIHEISLEGWSSPDATFRVRCGKGTYIRSLAHDLGARLGVGAPHVALRRTRVGAHRVDAACDVFVVEEAPPLLPLAAAVSHLPGVRVDAAAIARLRMGQQAPLAELASPPPGNFCILDEAGQLVAIAEPGPDHPRLARVFAPPPAAD